MNKSTESLGDVLEYGDPQPCSAPHNPQCAPQEEQLLHHNAPHHVASARDKKTWQVSPTTHIPSLLVVERFTCSSKAA